MIIARQPSLGFNFGPLVSGGAGALAFSNPISAGIGAAIGIGEDLLSCGTIGQRGCQKRSDAALQLAGMAQIRQIAYQAETGQLDPQTAIAQIGQVGQAVENGYEDKASGNVIKQMGCAANSNVPASSRSAQLLCNVDTSLTDYVQQFQALVASFGNRAAAVPAIYTTAAAPGPSAAAQSPAAAPPASGANLGTIAVLAGGLLFAFMALR